MTEVFENRLAFKFDDSWSILKYDSHACYRNGIERLKGTIRDKNGDEEHHRTKALDVVAVQSKRLVLMEIKDFRGHRIETKHRLGSDLALETAIKTRDSVAGLVGAFHGAYIGDVSPAVQELAQLGSMCSSVRTRPESRT